MSTPRSMAARRHSSLGGELPLDAPEPTWREKIVIRPDDPRRVAWDCLMMVCLLWVAVVVPFTLGFEVDAGAGVAVVDYIVDAIFIADFILNHFTGFVTDAGIVEMDHKTVLMNYLRTWYAIDAISSVPWDAVIASYENQHTSGNVLKAIRVIRLLRLAKLLRVFRLKGVVKNLEDVYPVPRTVGTLLKLFGITLLAAHIFACCFHWIGMKYDLTDQAHPTWLGVQSNVWLGGQDDEYIAALYWAVSTLSVVGAGTVFPVSSPERIFGIFTMCVGVIGVGYAITIVMEYVTKQRAAGEKLHQKLEDVTAFCNGYGMPRDLTARVRKSFRRDALMAEVGDDAFDSDDKIADLSPDLANELASYRLRRVFEAVPALCVSGKLVYMQLLPLFHPHDFEDLQVVQAEGTCEWLWVLISGKVEKIHQTRARAHMETFEPYHAFCIPNAFGRNSTCDFTLRAVDGPAKLLKLDAAELRRTFATSQPRVWNTMLKKADAAIAAGTA